MQCQKCGTENRAGVGNCVACGAQMAVAPFVQQPVNTVTPQVVSTKSRTTAGILALLLGGLGIHKFYLGQGGVGVIYLLFCWTYIPAIIGFIEGITYLTMSDQAFSQKFP